VHQNYLLPHPKNFTDLRKKKTDGTDFLHFTAVSPNRDWQVKAEIKAEKQIQVAIE
jgi:hypothetical protein